MKPPKDFGAVLTWIVGCVETMHPVVFARFHDGEYRVCNGKPYKAAAGWKSSKAPWLKNLLVDALRFRADGYMIGISPPCCAAAATNYYIRETQGAARTFATVFHHANYRKARAALSKVDAVLVGDHPDADVRVPSNGVEKRWNIDEVVKQLEDTRDKPIFLAAGPVSCVIAHKLKLSRVKVPVIDIGALLDDRTPRHYKTLNTPAQRHVCTWTLQSKPELKRVGGVYTPTDFTSPVRRR